MLPLLALLINEPRFQLGVVASCGTGSGGLGGVSSIFASGSGSEWPASSELDSELEASDSELDSSSDSSTSLVTGTVGG